MAEKKSTLADNLKLGGRRFGLVTMHRPGNVDDATTLEALLSGFNELSKEHNLILIIPIHPRTERIFNEQISTLLKEELKGNELRKIIPSISFLDITALEMNAEIIFTDSGGVPKEAYYFKKPCVIMLEETPWLELAESGTAILRGSDPDKIKSAYKTLISKKEELVYPEIFGDEKAAYFICEKIMEISDRW